MSDIYSYIGNKTFKIGRKIKWVRWAIIEQKCLISWRK